MRGLPGSLNRETMREYDIQIVNIRGLGVHLSHPSTQMDLKSKIPGFLQCGKVSLTHLGLVKIIS